MINGGCGLALTPFASSVADHAVRFVSEPFNSPLPLQSISLVLESDATGARKSPVIVILVLIPVQPLDPVDIMV